MMFFCLDKTVNNAKFKQMYTNMIDPPAACQKSHFVPPSGGSPDHPCWEDGSRFLPSYPGHRYAKYMTVQQKVQYKL